MPVAEKARVETEHPGAGDDPALDGPLDVDVGVHRALGLQVADRGEAVVERDPGRDRGPDGRKGVDSLRICSS